MKNLLIELKASHDGNGHYVITSDDQTNCWTIDIYENPVFPETGKVWDWQIAGQYFSNKYAERYVMKIIQEKKTGVRIIKRPKSEIPIICGNGINCKHDKYKSHGNLICNKLDTIIEMHQNIK